jgi:hypothetical protein
MERARIAIARRGLARLHLRRAPTRACRRRDAPAQWAGFSISRKFSG